MMNDPLRLLVTGFEPFGEHTINISADVAKALHGLVALPDPVTGNESLIHLETAILSVDEPGSKAIAGRLEQGEQWDAIVHLGLCESCQRPRIERLAQNRLDMRIADNQGRQLHQQYLDEGGHQGCPVDVSTWNADHFPTRFDQSFDAGAFVCNETYYRTLSALGLTLASRTRVPCLFLHLPSAENTPLDVAVEFVKQTCAHLLHPPPSIPVVAACMMDNQGRVLVAQRHEGGTDPGCWEFPGGKCREGEPLAEALMREMKEELNLNVEPSNLLGVWLRTVGNQTFSVHLIQCSSTNGLTGLHLSDHARVEWVHPDSVDERRWAGRDGEMMTFLRTVPQIHV